MDAQGLPIVSPKIDFHDVDQISARRLLCFLNHFSAHTVDFLNTFATSCEQRLAEVNCRIQKTEATLSVLEAKLSSIPGLEHVSAPLSSSAPSATSSAPSATSSAPSHYGTKPDHSASMPVTAVTASSLDSPLTLPELPRSDELVSSSADCHLSPPMTSPGLEVIGPATSASGCVRAADHPAYAKYFRMLHLGVPLMAVNLKCRTENPGLNETVLETPNRWLALDADDSRPEDASDGDDDRGWSQ